MDESGKTPEGLGGYIFVSHSHEDIKKVRLIRNYLENREIEPILFYLRCMKDGTEEQKAELWSLIRREIDGRDWFLYLDSENARNSRWVQREKEYAEEKKDGHIIRLNLEEEMEALQSRIEKLGRAMRAYISYSHNDEALYLKLKEEFKRQDFQVLDLKETIQPGDDWLTSISKAIDSVCRDGCYIPLITETSCKSHYVANEVSYAFRNEASFVYPVATEKGLKAMMSSQVRVMNYYMEHMYIRIIHQEEDIPEIVKDIRKNLMERITE